MNPGIINHQLLAIARQSVNEGFTKRSFVPGGDPSMMAGGGGAPPDPSMGGGGAPPADPSMGGGGGAPPPADPGMGGGGNATLDMVMQKLNQLSTGGMGGAGGAGGAPLKPKIDVNVEMMQIKNMLAKICDHLGIQIPAQDMVATPEKLMAMSQGQSTASPAGTGAPQGGGAIGGVDPMQGMQPAGMPGQAGPPKTGSAHNNGYAFGAVNGLSETVDRVQALRQLWKRGAA